MVTAVLSQTEGEKKTAWRFFRSYTMCMHACPYILEPFWLKNWAEAAGCPKGGYFCAGKHFEGRTQPQYTWRFFSWEMMTANHEEALRQERKETENSKASVSHGCSEV